MNREIIFRAWDKKMSNPFQMSKPFNPFFYGGLFTANCVFMQFTGLIDKNGVKVFEGDIIRRSLSGADPTTTNKVYFHDGCFVIGEGEFIKPLSNYCTVEVIGNVHENPELLESSF